MPRTARHVDPLPEELLAEAELGPASPDNHLPAHFLERVVHDLPYPLAADALVLPDRLVRPVEAVVPLQDPAAALVEDGEDPVEPPSVLDLLNEGLSSRTACCTT